MIILLALGCLIVGLTIGFFLGIRYCTKRMLPSILGAMDTKELAKLATDASKLRGLGAPASEFEE